MEADYLIPSCPWPDLVDRSTTYLDVPHHLGVLFVPDRASNNVVFMKNMGGSTGCSGVWTICGGSSQTFSDEDVSSDGSPGDGMPRAGPMHATT